MSGAKLVTFGCTALVRSNKAGKLSPDANGYYPVILGALDVFNSAGAYYEPSAKELFKEGSSLMRRIARGQLRGEYGHPKREPGMTYEAFVQRILTIEETKVCFHIKEIELRQDLRDPKTGRPVIAIMGKIKPSGPHGETLRKQLENPDENVSFSIRSLTDDRFVRGVCHKSITNIITWDYVNEPGIALAEKYLHPGLESHSDTVAEMLSMESMEDDVVVPLVALEKLSQQMKESNGVSMECSSGLSLEELIQSVSTPVGVASKTRASLRW